MVDAIRTARPDWNVEVLAINPDNRAQYASLVSSATTLPWLQDTAEEPVWTRWGRAKDELCIVDTQGRIVTVMNLGYANLEDPGNREAVRNILLAAARAADIDADQLPDAWEDHYFGGLGFSAEDDGDQDGLTAFAEFAFGTDPTWTQGSSPLGAPSLRSGSPPRLTFTYRRRAGGLLDYWLESSPDLRTWQRLPSELITSGLPRNLYDGTGMAETQATLRTDSSLGPASFVRLRAQPRP